MDLADLLVALVGGTCLGVIAKAAFPGDRKRIPLWLTVLGGVAGGVGGAYAYRLFFEAAPAPVDWWRHGWQFLAAVALVTLAAALTGRQRSNDSAMGARGGGVRRRGRARTSAPRDAR